MPEFPDLDLEVGGPDPSVTGFPVERQWWLKDWPDTIDRAVEILQTRAIYLNTISEEGIKLRELLEWVERKYQETEDEVKAQYPIAYVLPSYNQCLLLNAWWCGIDFPICFAANRIGKTAGFAWNGMLWILPNNPEWLMFTPRPDPDDPTVTIHVLQRPPLPAIQKLKDFLKEHPDLMGDPMKPYYDEESGNARKFATLQSAVPEAFSPAWPSAPIQKGGTVWLGAPDNKYHREIVMPEWKRWLPASCIKKWSESENNLYFQISTLETGNPNPTVVEFICKSYESKDTKWSGSAVLGIVLTEGLEPETLDEIKQRIKENGFMSWDYTPYEAANVGKKTALAQRVYEKKEEMPLNPFCFVGFRVIDAPDRVIPPNKKADLLRMWSGKAQGRARIEGLFFSSSPKILAKLDRPFHCIPWSWHELRARFPSGQLFRFIDPGYDHPTACCWGLLTAQNVWYIYRYYVERMRTIAERCADIIELSRNTQHQWFYGKRETDYSIVECHTNEDSEVYVATVADYHTFKADETTGRPLSVRYIEQGLAIIPSVTTPPKDRALDIDKALDKLPYYVHPVTGATPSSRVFFLINEPGVGDALDKMEELYWERYKTGDRKNMPKDEVPKDDDDELDVFGYMVSSPFRHSAYRPQRRMPPDNSKFLSKAQIATLQSAQFPGGLFTVSPEGSQLQGFGSPLVLNPE